MEIHWKRKDFPGLLMKTRTITFEVGKGNKKLTTDLDHLYTTVCFDHLAVRPLTGAY